MYFHPVKSIDINKCSKKLTGFLQIQQEIKYIYNQTQRKKILLCIKASLNVQVTISILKNYDM